MEKMSDAEIKKLRELQAKEKRIKREQKKAEKEFFKQADARKEELLKRWGYRDELAELAEQYGCTRSELVAHIGSDRQVSYYKSLPRRTEIQPRQEAF